MRNSRSNSQKNYKLDFPAQTGPYAVKVKNGAGWRDYDTARLQISVGQPYHEGDKLAATLDWVSHRFKHVIICVNDTLQSSNYRFEEGLSSREAFIKASDAGSNWLVRNRHLIERLPSVEIHRWEDWKISPDFARSMHRTIWMYKNNREFHEAVTGDIEGRWQRRTRNSASNDSSRQGSRHCAKYGAKYAARYAEFNKFSRQYLLEETAIFAMMYNQDRAVDVYPGSSLLPCTLFQGREIEGAPQGLERGAFTRIDFSRRKTPTPKAA